MSFGQYLKDTQAELRHVAWPTRTQTIVYTIFVAAISIGVALYLGFFDFLFTTGLSRALNVVPSTNPMQVTQQVATGSPIQITPSLNISTTTQ
jgi:preprotein translocase SecE subunit